MEEKVEGSGNIGEVIPKEEEEAIAAALFEKQAQISSPVMAGSEDMIFSSPQGGGNGEGEEEVVGKHCISVSAAC